MKKTGILFFCALIGFVYGCKKNPAQPQAVSAPAAAETTEAAEISTAASEPQQKQLPEVQPQKAAEAVQGKPDNAGLHLEWFTDFAAAQKKASQEGKDLFMNFSGSDWCVWCKRLDEEVFSYKIFIYMAQQHFVFVMLDFPRTKPLSDELKKQNEELARKYSVQAFPTIVLADADGRPYAQTGYDGGGPLMYLENLADLQSQKPAK